MRNKLIAIFAALILSASAFAGTVTDSANLFGPDFYQLEGTLQTSPVFVETFVRTPGSNLKTYADNRVRELTSKGFIIVVTSQPREWRISMNPIGLAGSEKVRQIGDQMVQYFKRGQHADGIAWAASQLELAARPAPVYVAPVAVAPVASPAPTQVERSRTRSDSQESSFGLIWWVIGGIVLGVVIALIVINRNKNQRKKELEEQERLNEEFRKRHNVVQGTMKKTTPKTAPKTTPKIAIHPDDYSEAEKTKAQEYYGGYTREERENITRNYHHYSQYNSGILDNPLMFYWFMTTIVNNDQPHYVQAAPTPAPEPINYTPPPAPETTHYTSTRPRSSDDGHGSRSSHSRNDDSNSSYSSPSSSDSYGGGGSFDSGGSSGGDSSGGGGSW